LTAVNITKLLKFVSVKRIKKYSNYLDDFQENDVWLRLKDLLCVHLVHPIKGVKNKLCSLKYYNVKNWKPFWEVQRRKSTQRILQLDGWKSPIKKRVISRQINK
jgi:hypothetical protein